MSTAKSANTERRLTTTSFAILTQLALRSWSPYELVQQRIRYFRFAWPSAESAIYREMKRLAQAGLASTRTEHTGRRARTVYSITDAGLEALREWLDTPVDPFALEFEAMIRLFAVPVGEDHQIVASLEQVRKDAQEMLGFAAEVQREFIEGRNPLQDQTYVRALAVDFFVNLLTTVDGWAERTLDEIRDWEGRSLEERNRRGLEILVGHRLPDPEKASKGVAVPPASQDRRR
jgi:DNA-binding PadR family transcriptional regulator